MAALLLAVLPGTLTVSPAPASASAGPIALGNGEGGRWWKIRITRPGFYYIGCNQLAGALGVPESDLATLQLYVGGGGGLLPAEVEFWDEQPRPLRCRRLLLAYSLFSLRSRQNAQLNSAASNWVSKPHTVA